MPYQFNASLPDSVTGVFPKHAQDIYRAAFNSAWDQYKEAAERGGHESREEAAHKVAWAAVKHQYQKGDDGRWHPKPSASGAKQ